MLAEKIKGGGWYLINLVKYFAALRKNMALDAQIMVYVYCRTDEYVLGGGGSRSQRRKIEMPVGE